MALRGFLRQCFTAAAFALIGLSALAQETPPPAVEGGCVSSTDWMRRNHMAMLGHQRDETVHEGARDGRFSLQGCITCHAVKDDAGIPVTVEDPKHFCRTCHDTAAVQPDCFQCHASRPELAGAAASGTLGSAEGAGGALLPQHGVTVAAVDTYLKETQP